jgi:TM2 domain-containing membrane protein YozV
MTGCQAGRFDLSLEGKMKQVKWRKCLIFSIFLGSLGVDRFYMGQVLFGILKILTCGGAFIWTAVDIILIARKHKFENIQWI